MKAEYELAMQIETILKGVSFDIEGGEALMKFGSVYIASRSVRRLSIISRMWPEFTRPLSELIAKELTLKGE